MSLKKLFPILIFITILQSNSLFSQSTICLNMIVKNETPVITRCLESVKPLIDYWVIVDTGSTDGTQGMIKEFMKDLPGGLYERPWVDFAHNRNEALDLAKDKADYILIIDADEVLSFANDFKCPLLDKDFYYIETSLEGTKYKRVQLINSHLDWKWKGVVHEALDSPQAKSSDSLIGIVNMARPEGSRSKDPQKFHKDALALEKALEKDPHNTRTVFYLAQSYRDAGECEKALINYEKRALMPGWDQEIFWSLLQIGLLKEALKADPEDIIASYNKAHSYRPQRAEPLYRLALFYRKKENYVEAYQAACRGLALKESDDILFVEKWVYDYGLLLEYSIAAYWTGHYLEAYLSSHLLLSKTSLPQNVRDCVEKNLTWINPQIHNLAKK